jgi:hypothetical protein
MKIREAEFEFNYADKNPIPLRNVSAAVIGGLLVVGCSSSSSSQDIIHMVSQSPRPQGGVEAIVNMTAKNIQLIDGRIVTLKIGTHVNVGCIESYIPLTGRSFIEDGPYSGNVAKDIPVSDLNVTSPGGRNSLDEVGPCFSG